MYKHKDEQTRMDYQKYRFILDILSKVILNLLSAGLLLGFGFWLLMASNMGPAYLPNIMDGGLDMSIRVTLLGLGALVWLLTPIWFFWSTIRYGYRKYHNYQAYKRIN